MRKAVIYLAITMVVATGILMLSNKIFAISKIEAANSCVTSESLAKDTKIIGSNIIFINEGDLKDQIKKRYNCVADIKISKKLPNTLQVDVANFEPSVQIEGTNLYLAANGQVTDSAGSKKPVLYLTKSIEIAKNQKITDNQTVYAAQIAAGLTKSDFTVASIRLLDARDIAVYSPQEAIAIFSSDKDLNLQIDSLQQVLAKARIDATKIAKIDLRFDKPVVTFK
ncbi:MAG: FtsQ-type POTRA domain-containing protein [Candidatus Curtissbacteria bacterium]